MILQREKNLLFKILKTMSYKSKKVNGRKILCKHVIAARSKFPREYFLTAYLNGSLHATMLQEF